MLEARDLWIVRAIYEQGSLVRAARVLGVGQPALTRSLAALEARLRGRLFERNRRGAMPTDLGRALLAEADEILSRLERLDRHLAEVRGAQVQTLSVVAGAYALETFAMPAAARMLTTHPSVQIRLVAANWADVPRAVRERKAVIGLVDQAALDNPDDFIVEPMRAQPGLFVVRSGHPLLKLDAPQLADIVAWPLVYIGRVPWRIQAPFAESREQARAAGRLHHAFPALIHESPTVALTAVRYSDAVAAVSIPIAATALRHGEVVALRWRAPWMTLYACVIRPRHHRPTEVELGFLDLLRTVDAEADAIAQTFLDKAGLGAATE